MQVKIYTIPAFDAESSEDELNVFLRSHKVLEVRQEFVSAENGAYWCFSIKYLENAKPRFVGGKKEKVDYREVLDEKTFAIFSKFREYRKIIAKEDAVPAFAVFTDAELSEIAKLKNPTPTSIQNIKGIGDKKVAKYGKVLLEMYQKEDEAKGELDS